MIFWLNLLALTTAVLAQDDASIQSFDCRPSQSCWPTIEQWQVFNKTVSGRLHATIPLGSPCFPGSANYNAEACANVKENYFSGSFRQQTYGSMENVQWEACGLSHCFPAMVQPQGNNTCSLGRLSEYYVDAESPDDITATLSFVKQHNIRLVVRNTGHDYLGRSASANSLALRTFKLKSMEFRSSFTAHNCPAANGENIGVIGAGVTAEEAYNYYLEHGKVITMGGCPSVGVAGGFGQTGGHGPLAPTYGLMVDQAVEFDVVTADGVHRTINECNDPDLFWAMRGGGGQSYAILTSYKFKVHPSTPVAALYFQANISPQAITPNVTQSKVLRDVITAIASNQPTWTENKMSGYDGFSPTNIEFLQILPGAGTPMDKLKELTKDFHDFISNHPDLEIESNMYVTYANAAAMFTAQADMISRFGGSGRGVIVPSRLVTRDQFASADSIDVLVSAMLEGIEAAVSRVGMELCSQIRFLTHKTWPANTPDTNTSTNPVMRDVIWQYVTAGGWVPEQPDSTIALIQAGARDAMEPVKAILPVQAAYANEADPEEQDWQNVFFGKNYDRLVAVKKQYDPMSVLNCWKCPGFLGENDPMYSCYGRTPIPTLAGPPKRKRRLNK
ncbi:hypothetical protein AJ80_05188 [Polytolypa hystricis UAMH7299]|uniref:FAD-binding PCMH-type domain-containing protein n=1 Tax=Polytolypa hystricis (strain UAMH7299) TaxID=1447883 RepID=A0A2B7Y650_POLH7|nr:hypothetical protein AJ80_05188 [Polytolypa hystricis UAMH7299]